jgi:hypothetical protein
VCSHPGSRNLTRIFLSNNKEVHMLGLTPDQAGAMFYAAYLGVLLVNCAAVSWLHRHRYTLRGMIRKLLKYL